MHLIHASLSALLVVESCTAFIPATSKTRNFGLASHHFHSGRKACSTELKNTPFFAQDETETTSTAANTEETQEEEIDRLVKEQIEKMKRVSKLSSVTSGVDFAPWMKATQEDTERIRKSVTDKVIASRARADQQKKTTGTLYMDSQAQELSGTGLKCKVIDESVELEWATSVETDTVGYVVKRRKARTENFEEIADYKTWNPLVSRGVDGGIYRYMDADIGPGGWVYRISEVDSSGAQNDICQSLVEIQTADEKKAGLIAGVGIVGIGLIAVIAGILADPMGGY